MVQQQIMTVIGRIDRALSRIEQASKVPQESNGNPELFARHERLKIEAGNAIVELDKLLMGSAT